MKRMISDAQAPLLRAVQRLLVAAVTYDPRYPVAVIFEAATSEDWASATYVGQRHRLELRLEPDFAGIGAASGPDADSVDGETAKHLATAALAEAVARLIATIGEAEIELPGHFVADIAVVGASLLDSGAIGVILEALSLLN